jgi:prevent-host-death family protein
MRGTLTDLEDGLRWEPEGADLRMYVYRDKEHPEAPLTVNFNRHCNEADHPTLVKTREHSPPCTDRATELADRPKSSHGCYSQVVKTRIHTEETLSQRELRNDSGRVLRAVSEGHTFLLTNSGVPVGRLVPLDAPASTLTITRPARRHGGWTSLGIQRKKSSSLSDILDEDRAERL